MPSSKNKTQLAQLTDKLKSANGIIFTDHSGLSVSLQNQLRQQLKELDAEYTIAKNTLLKISLTKQLGSLPQTTQDALNGATAILLSYQDLISSIKVLTKFSNENTLPKIKSGLDLSQKDNPDRMLLDLESIKSLSLLPSKQELLSKLVMQIQAPTQNLVRVINAPLQNLVYALQAIKDNK